MLHKFTAGELRNTVRQRRYQNASDGAAPGDEVSHAIRNESLPKIIINNTVSYFLLQSAFCQFQTITVSERCLIKSLPLYILFEKNILINILTLKMASPGNQHCASCIGALSFPMAHWHHG